MKKFRRQIIYDLRADRNQSFSIPMEWMVLHSICMIMNLKYPYIDLYERSLQFFLYSSSRKNWWFSKCIWIVINTLIYYSLFFISAVGTTLFFGSIEDITIQDGAICFQEFIELTFEKKLLLLYLLPILISITIGMIVLFCALFWNPLGAMMIGIAIYIASVYWENMILIGNYSMIIRNIWIKGEGDIYPIKGILFCILIMLFIIIVGRCLIQTKEVYKKGR